MARHIKRGDTVIVITGSDKGKTGKVLRVLADKNRVVVEWINRGWKHVRPSQRVQQGGRVRGAGGEGQKARRGGGGGGDPPPRGQRGGRRRASRALPAGRPPGPSWSGSAKRAASRRPASRRSSSRWDSARPSRPARR